MGKLILKAKELNINYVGYYVKLEKDYNTPRNCLRVLSNSYKTSWQNEFIKEHNNDVNSKLGTYHLVNPQMKNPNVFYNRRTFETDRILLTLFRTGSHNLMIETGRHFHPKIDRENRLCSCSDGIQTISHVLLHCSLYVIYEMMICIM